MAIDAGRVREQTKALWSEDDPPEGLRWIQSLSPRHYRLFIAELHGAYGQASIDDDWQRVVELLEDWEATAQLDANPDFGRNLADEANGDFEEADLDRLP